MLSGGDGFARWRTWGFFVKALGVGWLTTLLMTLLMTAPAFAVEKTGRLFYVGLAYDGAPPPGKDANHFNFATENLSALLQAQAEPAFHEIIVRELKGEAATRDALLGELEALKDQVQNEDLVIFYFGAHGATTREGWSAGLPGGSINGNDLRQALGKVPCPVVAVLSTCGSGGFARPRRKETPLPSNVTAICACRRKKTTGSQLDIALSEALAGFADEDANGEVTLREVLEFIPQRYAESFNEDQLEESAAELLPVLERALHAPLNRVLTAAAADRVHVWDAAEWRGGLRIGEENGQPRVQFLGWDRNDPESGYGKPDAVVNPELILPPGPFPPLVVEQNGVWYPARVVRKDGRTYRIHYLTYPDSDDETVKPDRMRFSLSQKSRPERSKKRAGKRQPEIRLTAQEKRLLDAINAARAQHGLKPLVINAALVIECREHANAMAQQGQAADSFGEEFPGDRIHRAGVAPIHWGITNGTGKNITEVVQEWANSPINTANILEEHVTNVGLGLAANPEGGIYAAATYVQLRTDEEQ